jgi:hypothetical protein
MKWRSVLVGAVLAAYAAAQGVISGSITSPQGPLEGATVRALNLATNAVREAIVLRDGTYALNLPSGNYDIFIRKAQYSMVTRRGIAVVNGKKIQVDAILNPNANSGVPGETIFQIWGERADHLAGDVPRTPEEKPDLSGVWLPGLDLDADDPPFLPWAAALQKDRASFSSKDDPRAKCLPSGVVRTNLLDLTKFVQTKTLLIILIEGSPPGFRQVYLDGRVVPADLEPSWMGYSVGHWDGDTLVIDTTGFHDRGWIDVTGKPQTQKLHVTERMHRRDLGTLDVEITIDDPGAYEHPWKLRRELKLAPGEDIREYVCNENEKPEHLVGK